MSKVTYLNVLFFPYPNKLSLLSKICKENEKMFTFKKLESENFDVFFLKTQFKMIILL